MVFYNSVVLSFHVSDTFHAVALEVAIDVDDNRDGHGTLGSADADGEEGHEEALEVSVGEEQPVERGEVDVNGVEHQLDADEHGNQVAAGDEAEDADEEQKC